LDFLILEQGTDRLSRNVERRNDVLYIRKVCIDAAVGVFKLCNLNTAQTG
jgi:hypothetical protein